MAKQRDFARSVWNFVRTKNEQRLQEITQIYIEEGEQLKQYLQETTPKRTGGLARYGTYSEVHENEGVSASLVAGYTNYPHFSMEYNGEPPHFDDKTNLEIVEELSQNPNRAEIMGQIKDHIDQTIQNVRTRVREVRSK